MGVRVAKLQEKLGNNVVEPSDVKHIFITGTAGFIGFHLAKRLLKQGHIVHGFDGMTDYYDVSLKRRRHQMLMQHPNFQASEAMLEDQGALRQAGEQAAPDVIIHLAAQAGVRYSLDEPRAYIDSNIIGTFNILDLAHQIGCEHLLMASTSSVYGANVDMPFAEAHRAAHPKSFYAATKLAGEAMAHSYAHLHHIPITMMRFFTVYGAWGRPDLALFKFVKLMLEGKEIDIYNQGVMRRDFTHVDDVARAISLLMNVIPPRAENREGAAAITGDSLSPEAPWRTVNIGNCKPVELMKYVEAIEQAVGGKAKKNMMPMQAGDVAETWADCSLLEALTGFRPQRDLAEGVAEFVNWYREFYGK